MNLAQLKYTTRTTLAGFMAVWLSGVVFLICCGTMSGTAIDAEFCPLTAKSAHCDKAEAVDSSAPVVERTQSETVDCCAFLPILFDKNRKLERTEQLESISNQPLAVRSFTSPTVIRRPDRVAFTPYLSNRQNTFVKNCVFRI